MRNKKAFVIGIIVLATFAIPLTVTARGPGHHGHHLGTKLKGLSTFLELNLSVDQQEALQKIIATYKNEKEKRRDGVRVAKRNLAELMHAGTFDEAAARKAFQDLSKVKEEMFVLRARMMTEMKKQRRRRLQRPGPSAWIRHRSRPPVPPQMAHRR